ncbi:MAG: DNA-processing protein DprA [Rhodospirillales bacterium]
MTAGTAKPLDPAERLARLRLIRSENVGPVTFHRLLERFGTAKEALNALPDMAKRGGRRAPLKVCPEAAAKEELSAAEAIGAKPVFFGDPEYPPLMTMAADGAAVLYVTGHTHLLTKDSVAVVGARNASLNGRRFAERLAAALGEAGLCVVSGMARGIDAAAHAGALKTGTVAVMAGGPDVIYPKENESLHKEIISAGAAVTEMPPGTEPLARHFPARNRLIAAMTQGVVVVEASPKSGSLITARMAGDLGREVLAVPGAPGDPRSRGTNQLIRDGAVLTETAEDVLEALARPVGGGLAERGIPEPPTEPRPPLSLETVAEVRAWIEGNLGPSPVMVDEIVRDGQFSLPAVAGALLELELAGRLERLPGGRVSMII